MGQCKLEKKIPAMSSFIIANMFSFCKYSNSNDFPANSLHQHTFLDYSFILSENEIKLAV